MNIKIEIDCHTESDAESALAELRRLVSEGFRSGFDQNATARFSFEITGSPVEYYRMKRNGKLLKTKYDNYEEAMHCVRSRPEDKVIMFDDQDYELGEA